MGYARGDEYVPYSIDGGEMRSHSPEKGLRSSKEPVETIDDFVSLLVDKFHSDIIGVEQLELYWRGASKNPYNQKALTAACQTVGIRVEQAMVSLSKRDIPYG